MKLLQCVSLLLFLIAACFISGCSSETKKCKINGTVKYKGEPISLGIITFLAKDSGAAVGNAKIQNGVYEIPATRGLPAGNYKVTVSYPDPKSAAPALKADEAPGPESSREVKELLPPQYNRATTLEADIQAGVDNNVSFDLK